MKVMLTEREAAARLDVSVTVMQRWRRAGKGPKYIKYGDKPQSRVRYQLADIDAFKEACTVAPREGQ